MKNIRFLFVILLTFNMFIFAHNDGQKKNRTERLRVLIVDGFNNHDWQKTTRAIMEILRQDQNIIVNVSTVPDSTSNRWKNWNPQFDQYDVVIQNTNDLGNNGKWPESVKKSLETYILNGGGMLAFHSANNAFVNWEEYNKMIGIGWREKDFGPAIVVEKGELVIVPAGQGEKTGHGKRVDTVITRLGNHPVHHGLPKQWKAADIEVYHYARGPAENISVLSYARDAITGLDFPTEWVVQYGKGHVYSSTFGHYWHNQKFDPPGIRCHGFRTILIRVVKWLAGVEIKAELTQSFPTKDKISLVKGKQLAKK